MSVPRINHGRPPAVGGAAVVIGRAGMLCLGRPRTPLTQTKTIHENAGTMARRLDAPFDSVRKHHVACLAGAGCGLQTAVRGFDSPGATLTARSRPDARSPLLRGRQRVRLAPGRARPMLTLWICRAGWVVPCSSAQSAIGEEPTVRSGDVRIFRTDGGYPASGNYCGVVDAELPAVPVSAGALTFDQSVVISLPLSHNGDAERSMNTS